MAIVRFILGVYGG